MNTYLIRSKLTIAILAFILFIFAGISSAQQRGPDKDNKDKGPYSIGSIAIFIHDTTRGFDPWAAIYDGDGNADGTIDFPKNAILGDPNQTTRTLLTEIWYPVKRSEVNQSATRATFDDYTLGDQQTCIASYFYFTADSVDPNRLPVGVTAEAAAQQAKENLCNKKPRNSFKLNKFGKIPTVDPTGAPYPVIIILHGATIPRAINGSMAENLARQGYIVITPDHTGSVQVTMAGSPLDDTPEGVKNRANIEFLPGGLYPARYNVFEFDFTSDKVLRLADAVEQRVLDVKAVLKELHAINNGLSHTKMHLQGKMDLEHAIFCYLPSSIVT